MNDDLARLRVEYASDAFTAEDAGADPMALFAAWFHAAGTDPTVLEPNAMSLATVAPDGTPSNRMVLLKGISPPHAAFQLFTNLHSRKATEALAAGRAAACWWWPGSPGRQVRAVGRIHLLARADVDRYFATRPPAAQVGAIASRQSRAVATRAELDERVHALTAADAAATPLTAPPTWGGLELRADELEFWQGRPGRVHDRIAFLRLDDEGHPCSPAAVAAAGGADAARSAGAIMEDPHGVRWLRVRLEP